MNAGEASADFSLPLAPDLIIFENPSSENGQASYWLGAELEMTSGVYLFQPHLNASEGSKPIPEKPNGQFCDFYPQILVQLLEATE